MVRDKKKLKESAQEDMMKLVKTVDLKKDKELAKAMSYVPDKDRYHLISIDNVTYVPLFQVFSKLIHVGGRKK